MRPLPLPFPLVAGLFVAVFAAAPVRAAGQPAAPAAPLLSIDGLGKGSAPLDGPWQFHIGDDPAWALQQTDDATGSNGWEQLSPDKPWGAQGHRSYTGYAWYRKHLSLATAPGALPDLTLFIPEIRDVYAIYWNGKFITSHGKFPPGPSWRWSEPPQVIPAGPLHDGVLAIRVFKYPLGSYETGLQGGLYSPPLLGSALAVSQQKTAFDYQWLLKRQFTFGIDTLEGLLLLLSFLAWWRHRSQKVLLFTALFCLTQLTNTLLFSGQANPFSFRVAQAIDEPLSAAQDLALWFLLLWLLELRDNQRLVRWTWILAVVNVVFQCADGLICFLDWSRPGMALPNQVADGILTGIYTVSELWPVVLVLFAIRKRLDLPRWLVAVFACLAELSTVIPIMLEQGSRFTNWTIGGDLNRPLFTIAGNDFGVQNLTSAGLLLAIVYAVYRYMQETMRRQGKLEEEFKSARELQQVLIPETLPEVPGYAVTSAYRPAQEVGGDFFQIIPLDGQYAGCTLVLLGDVSGKGLKAAMTVSLIVGAVRTLAKFAPRPAELLAELNQRLWGRMQGGFTTCMAMILAPNGHCVVASAGHPAPFLNDRELDLPGALPLGLTADAQYTESAFDLGEGDHFSLYTDGLLEARSPSGELFSFARVDALFATRPDAARATEAAVDFGQDDDITVLTLTRLVVGQQSTTSFTAPILIPA